jgi:hypothetical protein
MLNLIAGFVIAFLGWLLGRAIGYMIGFRGGRSLLEQSGRTQKFRLKTIDKGEKQFERFTWLGVSAALWLVSGIRYRFRPSCLHLVRQFDPAVFIVERQSLLLCLSSCQVGEEVTQGCCKVGNTKKLS